MPETAKFKISVEVHTEYLEDQSQPQSHQYVFAYTITIHNSSEQGVKLLSRHWFITDGDGNVQEVQGEGVIGKQPYIEPGNSFDYTSGAILATPVGTMHGSYQFSADDGSVFEAEIPAFTLADPDHLH